MTRRQAMLTAVAALLLAPVAVADAGEALVRDGFVFPPMTDVLRVVTLQDYNTRVVVAGVSALGLAAGVIGSFLLLRKRALLGDALSHATLPGIAAAFILMAAAGGTGKWLPGLLLGAAASGALGVTCILALTRFTRLKEDAALGIVLSVFFGVGAALLSLVQSMKTGSAAGLESFIYGKTASMIADDAWLIAAAAAVISIACLLLYKEIALLCFDADYAGAQGWPTLLIDSVLMVLVVGVTVIGLQAVGLILMIALLVIPPAAARFWTEHLPTMVIAAGVIGAVSGLCGALISALFPRLPAGALIVLLAGAAFGVSMLLGPSRGVLARLRVYWRLERRVRRQHLLRAIYELGERASASGPAGTAPVAAAPVAFEALLRRRSWKRHELKAALRSAARERLVERAASGAIRLTAAGRQAAWRETRNHRLWELFLITHADIAPSHVDRDADQVEHVLGPDLIAQLERQLAEHDAHLTMPASPHALAAAGGGGR